MNEQRQDAYIDIESSLQAQIEELSDEDLQAYVQFLTEILQATEESNGDAEVVYPLFAANTDKLDSIFAEILRAWATNKFEEAEAGVVLYIAVAISYFSSLIAQFPLGDKASNIEIAVASCETLLKVFTREAFPQQWAATQNNLALAYSDRIKGDIAENIEKAIQSYNAALQVRTCEAFPQDWAFTQNNLATAYSQRIKGDITENVEKAIQSYNAALQVYTQKAFPQDWAGTQNNLGTAYRERIKGSIAENIEKAITAYNAALQVYTQKAFPQDWAFTQNNLAAAYSQRIKGNIAENIEKAIAAYNAALQVYTQKAFPQYWAFTQNNLAAAYSQRIKGDIAENIEKAIAAYNAALVVFTQQAFPQYWAGTQNNLAAAYRERIKGDIAENIEKAIAAYNAALQVYTQQAFPRKWAMTQNNLAMAYSQRIKGDIAEENIKKAIAAYNAALVVFTQQAFPQQWATTQNNLAAVYRERIKGDIAENIEKSIQSYNAALLVFTQQAFPQHWAMTQNNLGMAYSYRINGDIAENIEKAIAAYNAALLVRTQQAFPQQNTKTLLNLGMVYQDTSRFTLAYNAYESAIATIELLRGEIISGEESKRKQAEEWNQLYLHMVEVCLHLKEETLALEYIERSKTRNLVELILDHDRKTIFPPNVVTQLEQLRDEIAKGQYQIQNSTAENPTALAQHLQELRQQKKSLEDKYLPVGSSFSFKEFQKDLDKNTIVIEWYITNTSLETFIITSDNLQRFNSFISADNSKAFADWNFNYLNAYYNNKTEWINSLPSRLTQLAQILNIEEILQLIPQNCSHLILIPHRYLHLFPLHALPLTNGSFLCDKFSDGVSYAPSCQLLQQVNLRQRVDFKSLFAIQNPTEDLDYTDLEVEIISSLFADKEILSKKQATQTALSQASSQIQQANYLHFSCHGKFNLDVPQDSCLLLAGAVENDKLDLSKCLTLGNLFERDFNLNQCRLVVLSACETGLIDFQNTSDEYIGLPSGFLYAGSSSVVSSLWTVNDLSTSFLMIKFIQNLKDVENVSVPVALNKAQTWLREATKEDLQKWASDLPLDSTKKGKIRRQLRNNTVEKPFHSPFHWAAFTAVGK
ncbi:CHAT domain-containing protein [Calothrix sp. CCY 0018]|uniref:CHAT domain-containing protein n=1 Tax=Calothrix sp. CCY 0018 TaxID=3103864 RepID=UPI0039C67BAE